MTKIQAWVAPAAKTKFVRQEVDLGPLGDEEVEVAVEHCGLCHSDLSVLNNEWGFSAAMRVRDPDLFAKAISI